MKIRTLVCFFIFLIGFKFGSAHIPLDRLLNNVAVFFIIGCFMILQQEKEKLGYPNKFGIPTRRTHA